MPKAPTLKARAYPPARQGNDRRNTITLRVPIAKTVYTDSLSLRDHSIK